MNTSKFTYLGATDQTRYGKVLSKYLCFCGKEFLQRASEIRRGRIKSCGCLRHGSTNTRLYRIFKNMIQRCTNPKHHRYYLYGNRGISLCEEWKDFVVFKKWALASGYEDTLTLDRINNDKGYNPNNCRWVNYKIQRINQKPLSTKPVGVYKQNKKWMVKIGVNNQMIYLGVFKTIEEASNVYNKARKIRDDNYFKDFQKDNAKRSKRSQSLVSKEV